MTEESFFYRKFNSSEFVESRSGEHSLDPVFIPVRTLAGSRRVEVFCPFHREWEVPKAIRRHGVLTACGHSMKGIPVELPLLKESGAFSTEHGAIESLWDSVVINKKKYTDSRKFKLCKKTRSFTDESFAYDEYSVPKCAVSYRIVADDEKHTFTILCTMIQLDKVLSGNFNFLTKLPVERKEIVFNIETGEIRKLTGGLLQVSEKLSSLIERRFMKFVNQWAGRKLTFSTILRGIPFLVAATEFPYEPNLQVFFKEYCTDKSITKEFLGKLRRNPECYNETCAFLGIKSCRSLRKSFVSGPGALETFRLLNKEVGITDLNIMNLFLKSEIGECVQSSSYRTVAVFFMKKFLKKRSQKSLWNIMDKSFRKYEAFFYDTLSMYRRYYRHIGEDIEKQLFRYGTTEYNHNLLSKIAYESEHENIHFKYSAEQKALEDSIKGYDFKLPEFSYELNSIGCSMHNCVASYAGMVKDKSCTIVYAVKDGEYKLCIEIRGKEVIQQRIDHNKDPEGEDLEVMDLYRERHGLVFTGNRFF